MGVKNSVRTSGIQPKASKLFKKKILNVKFKNAKIKIFLCIFLNFLCKIEIEWAAQGFTERGKSFQVFFSTIPPDLPKMGNFLLGDTWEILTHPNPNG